MLRHCFLVASPEVISPVELFRSRHHYGQWRSGCSAGVQEPAFAATAWRFTDAGEFLVFARDKRRDQRIQSRYWEATLEQRRASQTREVRSQRPPVKPEAWGCEPLKAAVVVYRSLVFSLLSCYFGHLKLIEPPRHMNCTLALDVSHHARYR